MVSALGVLEKRVQHHDAENAYLKKVNHELMPKNVSALHNTSDKKFDRLPAALPICVLGLSRKVDQRLAAWSERKI